MNHYSAQSHHISFMASKQFFVIAFCMIIHAVVLVCHLAYGPMRCDIELIFKREEEVYSLGSAKKINPRKTGGYKM